MAIAPYGVSEGRTLIITPSLVIREGISDEFDTRTALNFWSKRKVILDDTKLPNVYRYAGYNTVSDKKRVNKYLENSDIVIANIHKVYNNNSRKDLISLVSSDFFDMIIIDEAHHSAADSWVKALEYFEAKKVIKLTATPYRADEKELGGKIIYTYELADAIKDGIVKNIVSEDYTSQNLEFEIDGEKISKNEALKRMDKGWVSRSVAYSYECSKKIVEMSVDRLKEKRRLGGSHHQIVAVACSIKHAKDIMDIYNEYGLKSAYVSSDRPEESEQVIIEFKKGQIDVLVNIDMLSEGFDHPNISIAAIFRPFRTLSPYAQFIGRALRRLQGEKVKDEIDNIAHVIYHKELDLDELWEYYTGQKNLANTKRIIQGEFEKYSEGEYKDRKFGEVTFDGELIVRTNTFLNDNVDKKYLNAITGEIERREIEIENIATKMREVGVDENTIKQVKEAKRKEFSNEIDEKRLNLREDLIREEVSAKFNDDIIERVASLYEETNIDPKEDMLPKNTSNMFLKNSNDNAAYIMKYIHYNLKKKLKRAREEWEMYDFEEAKKILPIMMEELKSKIERVYGNEKSK
ncbi:DEAD/DEAH box helicase [Clostridium baratii]|uniref:DEAD/DEAH box helicase n=1 Tax=Clostridium baratii TaxID=1561 RepID=UPI0030D2BF8F